MSSLKSKAHWVKSSLERKSPEDAMKYANDLKEMFTPFVSKYSSLSKAKDTIGEIQEILNRVDTEVAPMVLEREIESAISSLKSKAHWVKSGLDNKDPHSTMKHSDELREKYTPFVEKYSNQTSAKSFIEEINKLLERVDNEVTPMIAGLTFVDFAFLCLTFIDFCSSFYDLALYFFKSSLTFVDHNF